jgi:hypothetical protein
MPKRVVVAFPGSAVLLDGPAGTKAERHQEGDHDSAGHDEDRHADAFGGGESWPLAKQGLGLGVGHQNQQGEAERRADSGARGDEPRGDPLVLVVHPGRRRDEHGREHDAVTDADCHQTGG